MKDPAAITIAVDITPELRRALDDAARLRAGKPSLQQRPPVDPGRAAEILKQARAS